MSVPFDANAHLPANLQARVKNLLSNVANVAAAIQARGGNGPILSIDKLGVWNLGQESIKIGPEDLFMVDIASMKHGYCSWHEQKPTEHLVPAGEPKMDPSTLPTPPGGKPWQEAFYIEGRFVAGKQKGQKGVYPPSSLGGAQAFKRLIQDIYRQAELDQVNITPVLQLGVGSYNNKTHGGVTFYPILTPVAWERIDIFDGPAPELPKAEPEPPKNGGGKSARAEAPAKEETPQEAYQGTMGQRAAEDTEHAETMAAGRAKRRRAVS